MKTGIQFAVERNRLGSSVRQWILLRKVYPSRYMTVEKLATELNSSIKTIRRDILALQAAGFPLWFDRTGDQHFIRLEQDWFLGAEPKRQPTIREVEGSRREQAVAR